MKKEMLVIVLVIAIIAAAACLVMGIIAIIGSPPITDGCLFRYNKNDNGDVTINTDRVTNTVNLRADGNYTAESVLQADGSYRIILDAGKYGKWVNTNLSVADAQKIIVKITGEVSLCRAYIPKNNLQANSNIDFKGARIPIPRIEETGSEPISLTFDATSDQWRNLAEIYFNDKVVASISPNIKPIKNAQGNVVASNNLVSQTNIFTGQTSIADCTEGKRTYSPICGRYSIYSGSYVSGCITGPCQCNCDMHCDAAEIAGRCPVWSGYHKANCRGCCYANAMGTMPEAYRDDGLYTSPWISDIDTLPKNFNSVNCVNEDENFADQNAAYINEQYQKEKYFWFSADSASALLYRFDDSENPTNAQSRGNNYVIAKIDPNNQTAYNNSDPNYQIQAKYNVIIDQIFIDKAVQYLQFRYVNSDGTFQNNTGGYTLNIKQTKCRRTNGVPLDDSFQGRGTVQYIVVPFNDNPNTVTNNNYNPININPDSKGSSNIQISSNDPGYIWLRILNNNSDYKDSFGQYSVQFFTSTKNNSFVLNILNPLFDLLKGKVRATATDLFKNMTCYDGNNVGSCINLFNYIKGLLSLYIMSYAMMFLLGMVQINQTDLVIRIIKISIVAGLLNEKTFDWFNHYFLDFILGFSDQIIANMSGYSLFASSNNISNPFMFMDTLISKILFSKIFPAQMMALLSMGITGILFFIIVFVAVAILLLTAFRAIAIYLMAFFAVAILVGLAPLFLTFMLFDFTRYLFDNWVRFTFRYMIEPVILMAGIIILMQLFTIYLDITVGYSVCWKCALPIKIPFPSLPGLPAIFSNLELFCINWFSAWGLDTRSGMMGINMQHVAALVIIAYCMYGYLEFASKITVRLSSTTGPSATQMGGAMSGAIEQGMQGKFGLSQQDRASMAKSAKERTTNMAPKSEASNTSIKSSGGKSNRINLDNIIGGGKK